MKHSPQYKNGYVTLLSVLVISAVVGAAAVTLLSSGIGGAKFSLAWEQSALARVYASSCAEEALEQIRANTSFSGNGALAFSGGSCQYTVTKLRGQNRTIQATGTVQTVIQKTYIVLDRVRPSLSVASWQGVGDFP